jgi:hypothetical protein
VTLKFDVREDMSGFSLHVDTAQTNLEIGATENELRRLMIDLMHEFEMDEQPLQTGTDQNGGDE